MKITSKNKNNQNKAGNLLQNVILTVTTALNLNTNGPYDFHHLAPLISKYYGCQIHVINGLDGKVVTTVLSEPDVYDDSKYQINLLTLLDNHVILISNLKRFFNQNRRVCFECKKCFSKNHYHNCKSKPMCHFCKSF